MNRRTILGFLFFALIISIKGTAGEVDARQLANSDQPFYETFPMKFTQPPVVKGQPTIYEQGRMTITAFLLLLARPTADCF